MTLGETLTAAGMAFNALVLIGGALYVRGRKDTDVSELRGDILGLTEKLEGFEVLRLADVERRGEQTALNVTTKQLSDTALANRERIARTETRVDGHEESCERRYKEIGSRFDRIDVSMGEMRAEVRNLALGLANRMITLPASLTK